MWAMLSTRLRTWLLLAVALPLARRAFGVLARRVNRTHPDTPAAKIATRVDAALTAWAQRGRRRARHS